MRVVQASKISEKLDVLRLGVLGVPVVNVFEEYSVDCSKKPLSSTAGEVKDLSRGESE